MLYSSVPAHEKRVQMRSQLADGRIHVFPGAFNPLSAMLIERQEFSGVYISGAVLSADLGLPDIGLTTLTEVSARAGQISRMVNLPSIVDADTGFGGPTNVARTVQQFEDAGVAAMHIEDQVNPKRCGHLDGKEVVSHEEALQRVRAAADARRDSNFVIIARTDIRAVDGLDAAIDRLKAFVDAGADVIFPEALVGVAEFEQVRRKVDVPMMANMTEFGKGELHPVSDLESAGVNIVIFPVSLLRLAMGAAERGLEAIKREGGLSSQLELMQTRADLYALIDYASYSKFDDSVYNFRL